MIDSVLSAYARQMEQYMSSYVHQPEGLVEVGNIGTGEGEEPCKIRIAMLSVERESASGSGSTKSFSGEKITPSFYPPLFTNLNIIIAAIFNEKRYKDALSFLSLSIGFLQSNPSFETEDGSRYTIEMLNPSLQDQSNIWTLFGGHYYPSIVCKIRRLTFVTGDIKQTITKITDHNTNLKS